MKLAKRCVLLVLVVTLLLSVTATAYAAEVVAYEENGAGYESIEPRADEIVIKYRTYNGVLQYRRWNQTKGYWVDPYWINA